ncbi:hypothetical protein I3843_15G095200 [Carya illinoinensis]|nr:hypothetical protein I3843_15G095200 [Carya illinoinensis]
MKVRSVKLRDAHKLAANNGRGSFCSVLWDEQALHLVTSSSSDPSISIHDPLLPPSAPKILGHHRDGATALAISPNSTCLASGFVDHSLKLYNCPGGMLAAAGDDEGIKLINTIDGSIARVLKGHKGPVTGLAFDPNCEYLASIDSTGSVIYWGLHSGRTSHTLKGIAPDTGLRNDVVMYNRDTSEKLFSLRCDHIQPIYKQDIDRHKFDETICCMAWKPVGNALAVINDVPNLQSKIGNGLPLFYEEEEGLSASGSLSDLGEDGHGESEPPKRKRLRKQSAYEETFDEDGSDEWSLTPKVESRKKVSHFHKVGLHNRNDELRGLMTTARLKMQEAFHPGATPVQPGKRHFLFFANPCKGEKNMSTLMYRPFSTWENNMMPKPVLPLLNLSFPLASLDLGADALENEFILNNMHLSQIQMRIEEMTGAGLDTTSLDDEAFGLEVAQDRCILRLIVSCCNVKLISMEKSMKGAIKLVTSLKLSNLAERFNGILEERLLNETIGMKEKPLPNSMADARMMADIAVGKTLTSAETSKTSETVITLLSPKLTAPLFTKKAKSQEVAKVGTKKAEHDQIPVLGELGKEKRKDHRGDKSSAELRKAGETSQSSNKQEMTKLGENQAQSHRPSNPFIKSSIK